MLDVADAPFVVSMDCGRAVDTADIGSDFVEG